jgi:hypothetical protein
MLGKSNWFGTLEDNNMITAIQNRIDKLYKGIVLWGYGWKSRKWSCNGEAVIQWRDPLSGLWYSEKMAVKLLKIQLLDELNLND